jgi:putative heme-binding domain-containing protein
MKAGFLLALAVVCRAQQTPQQIVENGRAIFRIYCSPCHGIKAEGGRAPDLTIASHSDSHLTNIISKGVAGTDMQAYEHMGDESIKALVAYIKSTARSVPKLEGNATAGEKLFWGKGGCGQCHTVGQRGGSLGPDLSRVGRARSVDYLRESVLKPGADLTPGYATITVVTKDGKRITGVERGFDNFSARFVEPSGKFHSYFKSDVQSATREERSLMPEKYSKLFSEPELNDLVSYMSSLRGGE